MSHGKNSLRNTFNSAARLAKDVISLPLVFTVVLLRPALLPLLEEHNNSAYRIPKEGVPLTAGETAAVKGIFGPDFDTTGVRKYFSPLRNPAARAETMSAKKIVFYGDALHSDDYSVIPPTEIHATATDAQGRTIAGWVVDHWQEKKNFELFIHEMTHVWQFQQGHHTLSRFLRHPLRTANSRYEYELTDQSRFDRFGPEQQASIIADYAFRFLLPDAGPPGTRAIWDAEDGRAGYSERLLKVVEDKFPAARKTRLALEGAREKATAPAPRPAV